MSEVVLTIVAIGFGLVGACLAVVSVLLGGER